jgi:hypothetical protein
MLEHRQVPVADVDGTYHVAIMWPWLKKKGPQLTKFYYFHELIFSIGQEFQSMPIRFFKR